MVVDAILEGAPIVLMGILVAFGIIVGICVILGVMDMIYRRNRVNGYIVGVLVVVAVFLVSCYLVGVYGS